MTLRSEITIQESKCEIIHKGNSSSNSKKNRSNLVGNIVWMLFKYL